MKEGKLKEYAKLIRLQVLGTSVTAVIGALTVKGSNLAISDFVVLFTMCMLGTIAGYISNDCRDIEIDKLSGELTERPLVKGTISKKKASMIIMSCVIVNFILLFIFYFSILPVTIRILSLVLGILYNLYSKQILGSDFLIAGSMALFCLFGAVAVSDNIQSIQDIGGITWIVVGLIFIHIFYFNAIEGGLKDVRNDRKARAKTLAVSLDVKLGGETDIPMSFKIIASLLTIATIILVFIPFIFLDITFWPWQIIILFILIIGMSWATIKLLNMKSYDRKEIGRYTILHNLVNYSLVPIILIGNIGVIWALFLILLPILWFIPCNYILYKGFLTTAKTF